MDIDPLYILQAVNISKSFPGVKALDSVRLDIEKGKVHAVMGENGAGKSTLMKILIGMYTPDSGAIYFKGTKIGFTSVDDAIKAGFSMIHQELFPFPHLTVAENIFMGNEPAKSGWINRKKLNKDAGLLLARLGVDIPVQKLMKECSIAEMQMVEIAKAISNNAEIIIMDEPTSAISGREVHTLFAIINELKRQGIAIIYISHKMDEIRQISDTITVMRDGKYISTFAKSDIGHEQLISLIVGRELSTVFYKKEPATGEMVLSVKGLTGSRFKNISFDVRKGEIVGIAGLMGAGRTEIVNAIYGLEKIYKGQIFIKGKRVIIRSPKHAIKLGIGLVSEDRKHYGLVLSSSVKHNITLSALKKCSNGPFINTQKEQKIVDDQILKLAIKTPSRNQLTNFLSGGNQQKVVLAKVLLNDPDIIILDEPTRGIDIGAKSEIYKLMFRLAGEGKAIIMISSELPEILGMSDRILVIHEGAVTAELNRADASQELIMKYAMSK
ncbi:MAG: sugar ABC transporter ATP-binding protein [Chitinophagaceae bacterium]